MKKAHGGSHNRLKDRLQRIVNTQDHRLPAEIVLLVVFVLLCVILVGILHMSAFLQQPVFLQVTALPYQDVYISGQQLDTTGMELTIVYSNGTTEKVTDGFSCSPSVFEGYGKQTVTVTYADKTATFEVLVDTLAGSGSCGENLSWSLGRSGALIISGSGRMDDFPGDHAPWKELRDTIKKVYLPEGLQNIGENAFISCDSLTEIRIPETVSSIGASAFESCDALQSCRILGRVREIEDFTFSGCISLQEVVLPQGLVYIGYFAFGNCSNLQSIHLPEGLTMMQTGAFSGSGLLQIQIPSSITTIAPQLFGNCLSLERVSLPSSITSIMAGAFSGCTSLKSLQIPARMTTLAPQMFLESGIERFTVDPANPYFVADDSGVIYTKGFRKLVLCPYGRVGSYRIQEGCLEIDRYGFYSCRGLTEVIFPASLQIVGEFAFINCTGLTQVNLPPAVKMLKNGSFNGCSKLTQLHIMNPSCNIEGDILTSTYKTVIYSDADSPVEYQAKQLGYLFQGYNDEQ